MNLAEARVSCWSIANLESDRVWRAADPIDLGADSLRDIHVTQNS